jgi:hypothetical protein
MDDEPEPPVAELHPAGPNVIRFPVRQARLADDWDGGRSHGRLDVSAVSLASVLPRIVRNMTLNSKTDWPPLPLGAGLFFGLDGRRIEASGLHAPEHVTRN